MFERVYLGPRARAEHAKIERVLRGLFDYYCEHPDELPAGRRAGGRPRDRLPGRDDRPLRDPRLDRALRPAGPRALMARYTDESRERVRDAVDFAELVGARTELKRAGVAAAAGAVPVPRGAHAVVRDRPGREGLLLLRLRRGRRRLPVRDGDRGAGLRRGAGVARRALPRAARARDRGPARGRASASGGSGCTRCWSAPRRTTCACCGSRRRPRSRASTWRQRGLREDALRAYRVGFAPDAWDRVLHRLAAGRLQRRRAARRGADPASAAAARGCIDRFRGRITFPLADERGPRARVRRAGDEARPAAQVPEHVRRRALPQGPDRLRRGPGARGGGAGRARGAGRGLHGRDRAAPGRRARGRRADGHGADRRADQRDRQARARRRCSARTRTARGRSRSRAGSRRCAAYNADRTTRGVEFRIVRLPAGQDPADVVQHSGAEAMRELLDKAVAIERFEVERALEQPDASTRRDARRCRAADRLDAARACCARSCPARRRPARASGAEVIMEVVRGARARRPRAPRPSWNGGERRVERRPRPRRRPAARRADAIASAPPAPPPEPVDPRAALARREQSEEAFLSYCIALPEQGERAAGRRRRRRLLLRARDPPGRRLPPRPAALARAPTCPRATRTLARLIAELAVERGTGSRRRPRSSSSRRSNSTSTGSSATSPRPGSPAPRAASAALAAERQRVLDEIRHQFS